MRFFLFGAVASISRDKSQDIIEVVAPIDLTEEGKGIIDAKLPVVNLLSLMQYLVDEHGLDLQDHELQRYWRHCRQYFPWGSSHPAAAAGEHWPLSIYGDEARYTEASGYQEKLVVLDISVPLWRPASTRNSRFVLWACRESLCVGHKTLWNIYRYIRWSLDWLYLGVKPTEGYLGEVLPLNLQRSQPDHAEPLCRRGIKFTLTEVRGDWAWHSFALQLRPRWNSAYCCFKCGADNVQRLDFSLTAEWIDLQYSHHTFMNFMLKGPEPCALIAIN